MIGKVTALRNIAAEGYTFAGDAADEIERLRAKIETAENDAAHQKALAASALRVAEGWERKCGELRAKVSDSAINVEYLGNLKKSYEEFIGKLQDERNDLQTELKEVRYRAAVAHDTIKALLARIEEMEQQEPFDANSGVFRGAFEAALKAGNWPMTRQGDGYRSPSTQIAWRVAFSTVNRLKLYLAPGAKGE